MKRKFVMMTAVLLMIAMCAPASFAVEKGDRQEAAWAEVSDITAEDGINEDEILAPDAEEGILDAAIETGSNRPIGPMPPAIKNHSAFFNKTAKTRAKFKVNVTSTALSNKIKVTAYLQKKSGSTYKYADKKVTYNAIGSLAGNSSIAVTEKGSYRMRIVIKEYKGTSLVSDKELYRILDRNGY